MKIIDTYIVINIGEYTKAYLCQDKEGNQFYFAEAFDGSLMDIDKNHFEHLITKR